LTPKEIEVFTSVPQGFSPKVEVAANYLEADGKFLFLQLSKEKEEVGCWGVPAGKIGIGEDPFDAANRELFEETGVRVRESSEFFSFGRLYFRKPDIDYVYHLFYHSCQRPVDVVLSREHQSYCWASTEEIEQLPLMAGAIEAFQFCCAQLSKSS